MMYFDDELDEDDIGDERGDEDGALLSD